jgi:predicted ArsR family transcriptional regulator
MQDVIGSMGGYRGVRAELLVVLKKAQPLTATELAERFGLTPNALRRHLKVLEEDGVVRYQREVRGVGAPVFAYRLTEAGEAVFPRRYAAVLASALEALQAERGGRAVANVLAREWDALAIEAGPVLDGLPLAERVQLVAELLTARGYMAEGDVVSGRVRPCASTTVRCARSPSSSRRRATWRRGSCRDCSTPRWRDARTASAAAASCSYDVENTP